MKKVLLLVIILLLIFSTAGCPSSVSKDNSEDKKKEVAATTIEKEDDNKDEEKDEDKNEDKKKEVATTIIEKEDDNKDEEKDEDKNKDDEDDDDLFVPLPPPSEPYLTVKGMTYSLCFNGSENPIKIEGIVDSYSQSSRDGRLLVLRVFPTISTSPDLVSYLVLISDSEQLVIAQDVYRFYLCCNDTKIAYVTDIDENFSGSLYLYDIANGTSNHIADNVYHNIVTISPDGQSIGYGTRLSGYDFTGFVKTDGEEPVEIGTNKIPVAISNNQEYIYYFETTETNDMNLYVRHNNEEKALGTIEYDSRIHFNKDRSEVLYSTGNATYITEKFDRTEKISDLPFSYLVSPPNTRTDWMFYGASIISREVESFRDHLLFAGNDVNTSIIYINEELKPELITDSASWNTNYDVSSDWKSLVYVDELGVAQLLKDFRNFSLSPVSLNSDCFVLKVYSSSLDFSSFYLKENGNLYHTGGDGKDTVLISSDVEYFEIAPDYSCSCYIDSSGSLFLINSNGDIKQLGINVDSYHVMFSSDSNKLFYQETVSEQGVEDVFFVKDCRSDDPELQIATNVKNFSVSYYGIYYKVFDHYYDEESSFGELYNVMYSKDGVAFSSVMNDAPS